LHFSVIELGTGEKLREKKAAKPSEAAIHEAG
jgi:hypothetical protein